MKPITRTKFQMRENSRKFSALFIENHCAEGSNVSWKVFELDDVGSCDLYLINERRYKTR